MRNILYIISVFCLFNATLFGQNQVADTTDLKLISNINKGKVVTVTSTAYQGDYTATNVSQTPNASTIFASSVRNGWYWVKVQDALKLSTSDTASMLSSYRRKNDLVVATDYTGIYNDGTAISETNFINFINSTNGKTVYFSTGTYDVSGISNPEVVADISWYGDGRNTIIEGLNNFKIAGNVNINNISFKDGTILFRLDAFTSTSYTKNHFIVRDVYMQNCGHLARNRFGTNVLYYDEVIIDNVIQDTINSGNGSAKAFIQWDVPAQHISLTNILIQYNTDSNYVTPILFSGANNNLIPTTDTTFYFDNITFKNLIVSATNAPAPVTSKLLMIVDGEGADVIANNIHAYECNLPQFDFRGTGSRITLNNWDVYCPNVVSTATFSDYFLINKSVTYTENDWAFVMRNSKINIGSTSGTIGGIYFENEGDRLISNSRVSIQSGANAVVRATGAVNPTHGIKVRIENSSIIHNGSSGRLAFWLTDNISKIEIDGSYIKGRNSLFGHAVTNDTMDIVWITNSIFQDGFQASGAQRDVKHLYIDGCQFVGNQNYNFSATERVTMVNNLFRDDSISDPVSGAQDINFEFGKAKYTNFSNNHFDLKRTKRIGTLDHEFYADGLDTLIYNHNTGTIITGLTTCIPVRVDSVVYLEMKDNNIRFGGAASSGNAHPVLVLNSIDNAVINGNNFQLLDGTATDNFVEGLAGSFIRSLKLGDNESFTSFAEGDVTISAYADIVVHKAIDKDGNAYLTEATGYIQDSLYTQSFIDSALISQGYRELNQNDTLKTADFGKILYNDDPTNDTLYIPAGITADVISQYVGIETYNSASIVIITDGTQLRDIESTLIDTVTFKAAAIRRVAADNFRLLSSSEVYITASDTASMLTPYISRNDTAAAFAPFIERSDTASMLLSYPKKTELSVFLISDYGATGADATTDRKAIQAAIDAAEIAGGGTVYFDVDTVTIDSTVVIKQNVVLAGAYVGGQKRTQTVQSYPLIGNHVISDLNDATMDLFITDSVPSYIHGLGVRNMNITAVSPAQSALRYIHPNQAVAERINIDGAAGDYFKFGILQSGSINMEYKNIHITYTEEACFRNYPTNFISTTTVLSECYFTESKYCVKVDSATGSLKAENSIFENADSAGILIERGSLTLNGISMEGHSNSCIIFGSKGDNTTVQDNEGELVINNSGIGADGPTVKVLNANSVRMFNVFLFSLGDTTLEADSIKWLNLTNVYSDPSIGIHYDSLYTDITTLNVRNNDGDDLVKPNQIGTSLYTPDMSAQSATFDVLSVTGRALIGGQYVPPALWALQVTGGDFILLDSAADVSTFVGEDQNNYFEMRWQKASDRFRFFHTGYSPTSEVWRIVSSGRTDWYAPFVFEGTLETNGLVTVNSGIEDGGGNAYLTEATGYIQDSLYTHTQVDSIISAQTGWAHYIDTAYATAADSFYVAQGSTVTLPIKANMADGLVTSYLPNGVDSLFSQHDSTILGIATAATYTVRVSFKAKNSANTGYATIAFDIGTGGTPNIASSETFIFPKGAGVETQESKTVLLYSLDTFVANGCKIKVTADTGNLEIYDIRLLIRLDSRP